MKSLKAYIFESKLNVDDVVNEYLLNINQLTPNKKQHFLSRLALCGDYEQSPNFTPIMKDLKDVLSHIVSGDYDYVVREKALSTYKHSGKTDIISHIKSIQNEDLKEYLSWDVLLIDLVILLRNEIHIPENLKSQILKEFDLDKMLYVHRIVATDIRTHCGTIYMNFIGALRSATLMEFFHPSRFLDIDRAWNESRRYYTVTNTYESTNLYGITHTLINASNFYTEPIDVKEYSVEAMCISDFLKDTISNRYKYIPSLDLICEAALCDKMCGGSLWKEVQRELTSRIDAKTKILQNHRRVAGGSYNLEKNEHTNILYIMLSKFRP